MKKIDVAGQRFGRLTVIKRNGKKYGGSAWLCKCDCGNEKTIALQHLKNGTKSCGCLTKEIAQERGYKSRIGDRTRKHGDFGTKLYNVWAGMKRRCNNGKALHYEDYGGRGIIVCDEWHDYLNFKEWSLNNGYEEGFSLDRIDVNGDYEPSNCRWATWVQQQNNRRHNLKFNYDGKEYTLRQLSNMTGIKYRTLLGRYQRGWTIEQMLDTAMHTNKYK